MIFCIGNAQSSGGACSSETAMQTTLTQTLGLTLPPSLLVLEETEGATFASYRVLARMSQTDVAEHIGEALPGWTRTSSQRGLGGTTFSFVDDQSRTLRLLVRPVGRSNLFRLHLSLYTDSTEE